MSPETVLTIQYQRRYQRRLEDCNVKKAAVIWKEEQRQTDRETDG